ncbi:outer membrane protein assembly factor BamB [Usitatibacter palustris]|uniref:Outer membrane protein assembly factor BamB n=1 Tax=Usitatibacter palustris TaxID=2732487 RepID=A0A6M4H803_9PROT|nr:outer membrane protein assembly factor BamB [Usitatibacter palustris]QJR15700.1 Outer membrane protein assembly factor BamB [Usitatibacter palustris]
MIASRLVACGAALALAGCGFLGIGGGNARTPTPLNPITATVTPKATWSASVGKAGAFRLFPDIEGGKVYTANADGGVTILAEDTGQVATRFESKKAVSGGVAAGDSVIVVGTMKGDVTAFDLTGKELWNTNLAGEVISPASIAKKTAVVRTSDGRIYGISLTDGKRRWVYQRPSPALLLRTESGVHIDGGDVIAGYPGGKLIALDIDDGKLTWEVNVSLPRGATELERIADVAGVPYLDGPRVCAAAFQGKVACFEIQTRNMVWSRDVSSSRALAADAKNIYVVDDSGAVHALDKNSGASLWKQDKLLYRRLTAPVIAGGNVLVGDGYGFLHVLSPTDGSLIGRMSVDGGAVNALVAATKGVVVQTAGGTVSLVNF